MNMLTLFSKKAPNALFISIIFGALAGVLYSSLIPLVLSSISPEDPNFTNKIELTTEVLSFNVSNYKMAALFFVTCVSILVMRSVSQIILVRVAAKVGKDLRSQFYERIISSSLLSVENIGSSRLIASISTDIPRIVSGAGALPSILVNSITLIGMLGFLIFINFEVFKLVMLAILVGGVCFQLPMSIGNKMLEKSRETRDELQRSIHGLIYGFKELKLDKKNREYYFEKALLDNERKILKDEKSAYSIITMMGIFGDLISFFVIGAVCFVFISYHTISSQELVGVIMALLYITGPISVLLDTIPRMVVASISHRKLNKLLASIPVETEVKTVSDTSEWETIQLKNVEYTYPSKREEVGFSVGPINITLKKGDVTFLIGANGSGKSTLSKLLTLHYLPKNGVISFGEESLGLNNIESYRQKIGAIYSDYFLFDTFLFDIDGERLDRANTYLKMLELDAKVNIVDGRFSTLSLSDGQKKRMALLVSLMIDKEVYLFDEWAADQDPVFKDIFYNKILPELKAKNKVIIVISHDDRYFHIADKTIVMESGKVRAENESLIKQLEPA